MQDLDWETINRIGIPSLVLMEQAATGVAETAVKLYPEAKKILVVAGKGNNGGDGIAAARLLKVRFQRDVEIFLPYEEEQLKEDCRVQYQIANKLGLKFHKELPDLESFDLIIDAIFGTGFKPPIKGRWVDIVKAINGSGKPVLAVDIPSGISSDSGEVLEPVIKADATVTFALPKYGQVLYPSSAFCGKVFVRNISIPVETVAEGVEVELIQPEEIKKFIPVREPHTYKNREGHVFILGGSPGKTGAVVMAARAATEAGAGLVTVGVAQSLDSVVETLIVEEMSKPLPEIESGYLHPLVWDFAFETAEAQGYTSLVVGPGMGRYKEGQDIIADILQRWNKPLVIDADGLNNLADLGQKGKELLKEREIPAVLTPHIGEMQRLSGVYSKEIVFNQIDVARRFAEENNCFVVLKGARTVIATPTGKAFVNYRGTPAMAKGGSGDVLSGILGALVGKMEIEKALILGVTLHAIAGEIAEDNSDSESVRPTYLINNLGKAYQFLRNYNPLNDGRRNFGWQRELCGI